MKIGGVFVAGAGVGLCALTAQAGASQEADQSDLSQRVNRQAEQIQQLKQRLDQIQTEQKHSQGQESAVAKKPAASSSKQANNEPGQGFDDTWWRSNNRKQGAVGNQGHHDGNTVSARAQVVF